MRFADHSRFGARFHFRLVPFIATLVVIVIGCALGQWQLKRANQKRAVEVTLSARSLAPVLQWSDLTSEFASAGNDKEFRRLKIRGRFISQWPLYLDNRPYRGQAGLYLLMPFQIEGTQQFILIERGWIARDAHDRAHLPPLSTPVDVMTLEGILRSAPGRVMQLGQPSPLRPGAIVQNIDLSDFAQASGLGMASYLLEQSSTTVDGLVRDWPRPTTGIERHLGYAFQWFALAAMAAIFFVVTGFKRGQSTTAAEKV